MPVLNTQQFEAALDEDQDRQYLPPPVYAPANTYTMMSTRFTMLVPHQLIDQVLGRTLAPRAAYDAIAGAARDEDITADCEPFMAWLRVACTLRANSD